MKQKLHILENPQGFSVSLVLNGLLTGLFAGCVAVIYRLLLNYAEKLLFIILEFTKGDALLMAGWFLVLAVMGLIVVKIVAWE